MKSHASAACLLLAALVVSLGLTATKAESLDPDRVHFVDRVGQNALFRGNSPLVINSDTGKPTFAYDQLMSLIKQKVQLHAHVESCSLRFF